MRINSKSISDIYIYMNYTKCIINLYKPNTIVGSKALSRKKVKRDKFWWPATF